MSSTAEPSFWACLTLEFMNTVQRDPRSTGRLAKSAVWTKVSRLMPRLVAKVCRKAPQPEEQASLSFTSATAPSSTFMHFMSWPPMSMT